MTTPQLNLTIPPADGKPLEPLEVIYREGKAVEIKSPVPLRFNGHLQAPADWMENRNALELLEKKNCHVETDENDLSVRFVIDYRDEYRDIITGKLVRHKIIDEFKINGAETYTDKSLAKFFRQNAFYFENKELNKKIVETLMTFSAQVDRNMKNEQDLQGKKKLAYEQTVKTNVPASFVMKAPLFAGYEDKTFEVFICADCTSVDVKFNLESVDLFRMFEEEARKLIDEQVKRFEPFGCAVISK